MRKHGPVVPLELPLRFVFTCFGDRSVYIKTVVIFDNIEVFHDNIVLLQEIVLFRYQPQHSGCNESLSLKARFLYYFAQLEKY